MKLTVAHQPSTQLLPRGVEGLKLCLKSATRSLIPVWGAKRSQLDIALISHVKRKRLGTILLVQLMMQSWLHDYTFCSQKYYLNVSIHLHVYLHFRGSLCLSVSAMHDGVL